MFSLIFVMFWKGRISKSGETKYCLIKLLEVLSMQKGLDNCPPPLKRAYKIGTNTNKTPQGGHGVLWLSAPAYFLTCLCVWESLSLWVYICTWKPWWRLMTDLYWGLGGYSERWLSKALPLPACYRRKLVIADKNVFLPNQSVIENLIKKYTVKFPGILAFPSSAVWKPQAWRDVGRHF